MKIVLTQPQIPQNTGNIVRLCAVTGCSLMLVPPLGFSLASRHLKRAGLDYWNEVEITVEEQLEEKLASISAPFYFFSSKAKTLYTEKKYTQDSWLIFGSETTGLPAEWHQRWPEHFVTLPMIPGNRCLNLANSASIAVYEAWRQQDFK